MFPCQFGFGLLNAVSVHTVYIVAPHYVAMSRLFEKPTFHINLRARMTSFLQSCQESSERNKTITDGGVAPPW